MKKFIHVNQHIIRANKRHGKSDPVITVKSGRKNQYAKELTIYDDKGNPVAKIVYRPEKPLKCGAHCWVETTNEVTIS